MNRDTPDTVTELDVETDGIYPDDDEPGGVCCTRRENKWNPATWCGCQH